MDAGLLGVGRGGYYWVPGQWVLPPYQDALWTPGYWNYGYGGGYLWNPGFWGLTVGYYGGINYGFGYFGTGFYGGYWRNHNYFYNREYAHLGFRTHNFYSERVGWGNGGHPGGRSFTDRVVVNNNFRGGSYNRNGEEFRGGSHERTTNVPRRLRWAEPSRQQAGRSQAGQHRVMRIGSSTAFTMVEGRLGRAQGTDSSAAVSKVCSRQGRSPRLRRSRAHSSLLCSSAASRAMEIGLPTVAWVQVMEATTDITEGTAASNSL